MTIFTKATIPFLLFLLCFFAPARETRAQFNAMVAVDSFVFSFEAPFEDMATLAVQLTEPFNSDEEKARAIFMWIAQNVRYDCKKFHNPERPRFYGSSEAEIDQQIREYEQEQAERTAKYKRGICGDYSRLFQAMCEAAGLEAIIISGNARDFHKPYRNAHDNPHAWNAVRIDGEWQLLDATWGAGYVNAEVTKFTRDLGRGYFMTPPEWFALNHYPDDPEWQLLETPLDKKAFADQPLVNYGQDEYPLLGFIPQAVEVQAGSYDREIRIRFGQSPKFFMLTRQNGKPVDFDHQTEDGYDVFRFSSRGVKELILYGGEYQRSRMGWLARYDL